MSKRRGNAALSSLLLAMLVSSIFMAAAIPVYAATDEEIEEAVAKGMEWLAAQQNPDGWWPSEWSTLATTGLAVLKFETHAVEAGIDPFDPAYTYSSNITAGLDYIFGLASNWTISVQTHGDPDTDGDGHGVHWYDRTYETGIAMMAIGASQHPEDTVNVPGSAVNGATYLEVLQDAVDYLAWGQCDGGLGRGGWLYDAQDNQEWGSDNSNSGYAVLGLAYAETAAPYGFGLMIPQFVKDELNIWIDYIQSADGGSGYTDPDNWENILKTGNLLHQMKFVGDDTTTPRVLAAIDYIDDHFYDADYTPGWMGPGPKDDGTAPLGTPSYPDWPACYQAMFTTMKGLAVYKIDYISPLNDPSGIDWYGEFCDVLVAQQNPDGSWPDAPLFGGTDGTPYFLGWGDQVLSTAWALLTLEKVVPPQVHAGKDFRYTNVDFVPYELRTYTETIDVYEYSIGGAIEWTHTYDGSAMIESATLTIVADDVDGPGDGMDGEQDEVYFNGQYIGLLNDFGYYTVWQYYPGPGNPPNPDHITTTTFTLDPALISPAMPVDVVVEPLWGVEIETSTLTIEYWEQQPAELGDLLPQDAVGNYLVDVVVTKNDKVKSTNPGQLYGVIPITANVPVSTINVTDTFGEFFDVNPPQLGGGVEILVVDEDGYATVLTDQPGITCTVDNDANTVEILIDLVDAMGGPLEPDDTLMIYIKFQTTMKHETYTSPGTFENSALIEADGLTDEVSATIAHAAK